MKKSKPTKKELLAVLGELIAESATVKTWNGSEFHRAWHKALRVYRKAINL